MKQFFGIEASVYTRWFLGSPLDPEGREVDPRLFTQGERVEGLPPLTLPIAQIGDVVDFNLAAFDMPVTRRPFNEALEALVGTAIQRIPVMIEGDSQSWEILNVCKKEKCIDEKRTKHIMRWTAQDHRYDKAGEYRMIIGMKIDPDRVSHLDLFRVVGWEISLICSRKVKELAEEFELSGICFDSVS